MSRSGRLIWIKSVMLAVPIYSMMANALPVWARDDIEAACRKFFWAGADSSVRGKCAVSWPMVARPIELGGLRVLDLRLMGMALQVRWLWLQRNLGEDHAWSELPIKVAPEIRCLFEASVFFVVGDGKSALFLTDKWIEGKSIEDLAPALLPLVSRRTKASMTVAEGLQRNNWIRKLTGGLSVQAIVEYLSLWSRLREITLVHSRQDALVWRWSVDGQFSVRSAYRLLHEGSVSMPSASTLWSTWAPLRVKIFLWLAWRRRLWTADRRRRHDLETHTVCLLCNAQDETSDHLFFGCAFTMQVWDAFLGPLGLARPSHLGCESIFDWWDEVRALWTANRRRGGDSLFALICWSIWKERNVDVSERRVRR